MRGPLHPPPPPPPAEPEADSGSGLHAGPPEEAPWEVNEYRFEPPRWFDPLLGEAAGWLAVPVLLLVFGASQCSG